MKKRFALIIVVLGVLLSISGCSKETEPTNEIQGKWIMKSTEISGVMSPTEGSFLIFMGGASDCRGTDYSSQNGTVGSFSYSFNDSGDELSIIDNFEEGGNYNYKFKVLEFSETALRISTNISDLGQVTFSFSKEN